MKGVLPEGEWPRPKPTRVWKCRDRNGPLRGCTKATPCMSCRNRRNQASERRKQRDAQKALDEIVDAVVPAVLEQQAYAEGRTQPTRDEAVRSAALGSATNWRYDGLSEAQWENVKRWQDPRAERQWGGA